MLSIVEYIQCSKRAFKVRWYELQKFSFLFDRILDLDSPLHFALQFYLKELQKQPHQLEMRLLDQIV